MIWSEAERLPREELRKLQLERLQKVVEWVYNRVPFYRKRLDEAGVKPEDIKTLEDIQKIPFTTKDDLRDNYPFGMFAVDLEDVVRIHASSGTTGKPTVVGYTRDDIGVWAEVMARTIAAAGATKKDIIQNAYGYGLFTGGLGVHYGAERLGATVIPMSGGNTQKQIMLMQDFGSTVLACTPSYSLNIYEVAKEQGVDIKDLPLRIGIFGAEPWSENMRREIEEKMGIDAIDIYGLSEIIGPGVASECVEAKDGLHVFEDHFLVEIIDPATGEVLPYGEKGEVVFTTLTKQAFPLLRYRTKDISWLNPEPCKCGRTTVRMARIAGRTDDMLIIRGVNVFPSQIEHILLEYEGISPHYLIIVDREGALDTMEIQIEVTEEIFSDEVKKLEWLARKIENDIKDLVGVTARVKLVEPKTIERSVGKAKRVIDKRKL